MSTLSKRAAMKLVDQIRNANLGGHAIAARTDGGVSAVMAGFLGGLESVLRRFLYEHGCNEAAAALQGAMNDVPTEAEIAAHNAEIAQWRAKATGSAA